MSSLFVLLSMVSGCALFAPFPEPTEGVGCAEADITVWYTDADLDGFGDPATPWNDCVNPVGMVADGTDCDDADPTVNPGIPEICDSIDNDCDGGIDDADPEGATDAATYHADSDGDTYGDAATAAALCVAVKGYITDGTDCDDTDADVNTAASEICDSIDNDCDGDIDDADSGGADDASTWYADTDRDTFGDVADFIVACLAPNNYVADSTDCDDGSRFANPGATEVCDAIDNDCDGGADEGDPDGMPADADTWYADSDSDAFGDPADSVVACAAPKGYVADDTDCDDADSAINPGAAELCDGFDNDCDLGLDDLDPDGLPIDAGTWFADADIDGYGDPAASLTACVASAGYIGDNTDCDDMNAAVNPGAIDICGDLVDDDCSGSAATCTVDLYVDGIQTSSVTLPSFPATTQVELGYMGTLYDDFEAADSTGTLISNDFSVDGGCFAGLAVAGGTADTGIVGSFYPCATALDTSAESWYVEFVGSSSASPFVMQIEVQNLVSMTVADSSWCTVSPCFELMETADPANLASVITAGDTAAFATYYDPHTYRLAYNWAP